MVVTGGLVLAGGASTRFSGGEKALATVRGESLIERVVGVVGVATDRRPAVAVRTDDQRAAFEKRLDDVAFAKDARGFEGPLAGVVGGIDAVEGDWIFVSACDMPLLSAGAIAWLRGRIGADAVVPVHPDGTPEPLHAFYRRAALGRAVPDLPRAGGVRALLDALDSVRRVPVDGHEDLADSVTNVNSRGDLAAARRRLER